MGCNPDFAEDHCYFVKKAVAKDYQAYLRSPRYQEHLDRLAAAGSAGALAEDDLASATGEAAAAAPTARGEAASESI